MSHPLFPPSASPFLDPVSVEAWDSWVRWRHGSELRDLTIDTTWDRIAEALAAVEPQQPSLWRQRFRTAFAEWQLLLDPRILSTAGTGRPGWNAEGLCAALNVAAFVRDPLTGWARFDRGAFEQTARLAVRALDDALEVIGGCTAPVGLRIGLVGLADALALLGLPYGDRSGREQAAEIARLLARSCFETSAELAGLRGARVPGLPARLERARACDVHPRWLAAAHDVGLRHASLVAFEPMPRLAELANNVCDALDPLPAAAICDPPRRRPAGPGYAQRVRERHQLGQSALPGFVDRADVPQQIALRAALSLATDSPIDYPYCSGPHPDPALLAEWQTQAAAAGLPEPRLRLVEATG